LLCSKRTNSKRNALYVCATLCMLLVDVMYRLDNKSTMPRNESAHSGDDACPVWKGNDKNVAAGTAHDESLSYWLDSIQSGSNVEFMVETGVG